MFLLLCSCAGTHGAIERYQFAVRRAALKEAVSSVLKTNSKFTLYNFKNHYNDGENYITIFIKVGSEKYGYVLRYYGDEAKAKTSNTSEIFIAYARINGKGGTEGDVALTDVRKDKLLKVLKENLIDAVSSKLHMERVMNH